eukprot:TRINITY_DN3813_c3_g1_i1.p1 TRINITY_DN3813_c3_g1~~TRINITY_DN3813_c3_g1_i1.p1  ORF type:complete len:1180 (+),score=179.81 TRINITY_DN3813_c3_g1_i1:47-3586(+)
MASTETGAEPDGINNTVPCSGTCGGSVDRDEAFLKKHERNNLDQLLCKNCWIQIYNEQPGSLFSLSALFPKIGVKKTPALATTVNLLYPGESIGLFFNGNSAFSTKVVKVTPGSPGYRAGLEVGMIILTVAGTTVYSSKQMAAACQSLTRFRVTVDVSHVVSPIVKKTNVVTKVKPQVDLLKNAIFYKYPCGRDYTNEPTTPTSCLSARSEGSVKGLRESDFLNVPTSSAFETSYSFDADLLVMSDTEGDARNVLTDNNLKCLQDKDSTTQSSASSPSVSSVSVNHKNRFLKSSVGSFSKSGTQSSQGDGSSASFGSNSSSRTDQGMSVAGFDPSEYTNDGITLKGNLITSVTKGSASDTQGITKGMRLVTKSGELLVAAGGEKRFTGLVIRCNREASWGLISLDKPIFLKKGSLGRVVKSDSVLCGDVTLNKKELTGGSIVVGDRVEFAVRMKSDKTLSAIKILPAPGAFAAASERCTAEFHDAIELHASKTNSATRHVCMRYLHSNCKSKTCPSLHVDFSSLQVPIPVLPFPPAQVAFTTVPYKVISSVDLFRPIEIVFCSEDGCSLIFSEDGVPSPPFKSLIVNDTGTQLRIPELKRCLKVPSLNKVSILGELTSLCENNGVACNIKQSVSLKVSMPKVMFEEVDSHTFKQIAAQWDARLHGCNSCFWDFDCNVRPVRAWKCDNKVMDYKMYATQHNMKLDHTHKDVDGLGFADCYHGTAEVNILTIAQNGFDTNKRCGQAFGPGEYFAMNPGVSSGYCRGGNFMLQCSVLMGKEGIDYTFEKEYGYYIIKHLNGNVQAVPRYIIQFDDGYGGSIQCPKLRTRLGVATTKDKKKGKNNNNLKRQSTRIVTGNLLNGNRRAAMSAPNTTRIRIGWVQPETDVAIMTRLKSFLSGFSFNPNDVHISKHDSRFLRQPRSKTYPPPPPEQHTKTLLSIAVELSPETPMTQLQLGALNFKKFGVTGSMVSVCDAQNNNEWTDINCPSWEQFGCCNGENIEEKFWWLKCPYKHNPFDKAVFDCRPHCSKEGGETPFHQQKLFKNSVLPVKKIGHSYAHFSDYMEFLSKSKIAPKIKKVQMFAAVTGNDCHPSFKLNECFISIYKTPERAFASITETRGVSLLSCTVCTGHVLDLEHKVYANRQSISEDLVGMKDCYDTVILSKGEMAVFSPHQILAEYKVTL